MERMIKRDNSAVKTLSPTSSRERLKILFNTAINCLNPPSSEDQSFNFAINNEFRECDEFRRQHLNKEKSKSENPFFFENRDIPYKESENVTCTIKYSILTVGAVRLDR